MLLSVFLFHGRNFPHIIDLVDGLEETYYIADVLPKPKEFQNEAYYYALKKACKSMNDEIGKITEEKQDYQEYVESFAHEIKIPIFPFSSVVRVASCFVQSLLAKTP